MSTLLSKSTLKPDEPKKRLIFSLTLTLSLKGEGILSGVFVTNFMP